MDDIKKVLLETLCEFHDFCEEHDLKYFLIGGTLLGAVRHKGFIPWDDDIDVVMPRADYDKFIQLANKLEYPLRLRVSKYEKDYRYPFMKLTNEKIIVEESGSKPFRTGIWIDIFPLDYTFSNQFLKSSHYFAARIMRSLLSIKYDYVNYSHYSKVKYPFIRGLKLFLPLITREQFDILVRFIELFPGKLLNRKQYVANLYGAWGVKENAPADVFKTKKLYAFEEIYFWGPSNAHYWLKKVYNNYMELPPIEDRASHHPLKLISKNLK